jgi:hypothetical protein
MQVNFDYSFSNYQIQIDSLSKGANVLTFTYNDTEMHPISSCILHAIGIGNPDQFYSSGSFDSSKVYTIPQPCSSSYTRKTYQNGFPTINNKTGVCKDEVVYIGVAAKNFESTGTYICDTNPLNTFSAGYIFTYSKDDAVQTINQNNGKKQDQTPDDDDDDNNDWGDVAKVIGIIIVGFMLIIAVVIIGLVAFGGYKLYKNLNKDKDETSDDKK